LNTPENGWLSPAALNLEDRILGRDTVSEGPLYPNTPKLKLQLARLHGRHLAGNEARDAMMTTQHG
jgi:hypothetical protein